MTSGDSKVRRWSLNSLAQLWSLNTLRQLGQEKECKKAIQFALESYGDDEEVVAAGISALCKLTSSPESDLQKLQFSGQVVYLAALQHIPADRLRSLRQRVNIEIAKPDIIKTALVVVGLNRAPQNLFDPDYSNAVIVREAGKYDDPIVRQYSVWAITENDTLGVCDLGIDLKDIESNPTNVRGWVYRLLAMDSEAGGKYKDYIVLGSEDESAEVRAGLALGLKETFDEGLVETALNWFSIEMNIDVRQSLVDHFIKQADRSPIYRKTAIDAYKREPPGSPARERMLSAASGSALYADFKKIDAQSGDLFNGGRIMNQTNNISFGNNAQVGSVAVGGDAENSGTLFYSPQTTELLKARLNEAEACIASLAIPDAEKQTALQTIAAAKEAPDRSSISLALSVFERVGKLVTTAGGATKSVEYIIQAIKTLAGN